MSHLGSLYQLKHWKSPGYVIPDGRRVFGEYGPGSPNLTVVAPSDTHPAELVDRQLSCAIGHWFDGTVSVYSGHCGVVSDMLIFDLTRPGHRLILVEWQRPASGEPRVILPPPMYYRETVSGRGDTGLRCWIYVDSEFDELRKGVQ